MAAPLTSSNAADKAAAIAGACQQAKATSTGWQACCPAHEDSHPSLSIGYEGDKVLLHCHAGCSVEAICAALMMTVAQLFCGETKRKKRSTAQFVEAYDYVDEYGTLLFQVRRMSDHTFPQRRPDPTRPGHWIHDIDGVRRVLYHLPQLLIGIAAGRTIYLPEGEKDVHTVEKLGLVAACNPMGAATTKRKETAKWLPEYSKMLRGAHVALLPDHDKQGADHVAMVSRMLHGIAASIKIVPGIHTGKESSDVTDWVAEGGTREQLLAATDAAPLWIPEPEAFHAAVPLPTNGTHPPPAHTDIWMGTQPGNDTDWQEELFKKPTKKHDEYYPSEFNITHILRHDPTWRHEDGKTENAMWYDVIRGRCMIGDEQLSDGLLIKLAHWFGGRWRMQFNSTALLEKCVGAHCEANKRDLIQIWLNGLPPWDNTPRLDTWLMTIAQASDDAYTRHVSRRLPLSMVARALVPGCQYREVVILEGPQNVGKSHILQALASRDWYVEMSMNLETKESHMMLQSAWLAELSELDSMNRTEKARLKAFITMEMDTYVPKYRNGTVTYPRRTIMVGTTNDIEYLTDLTGNSRFLPVYTPGPITLEPLHEMREQLFAEALQAYRDAGEEWWRMSDEVAQEAAFQQEDRRVTSEWQAPLENWLAYDRFTQTYYDTVFDPAVGQMVQKRVEFKEGVTSWEEIARWFLGIEKREGWRDSRVTNPILNCLRAMGWKRGKRTRSGGQGQISHWYKPGYESAFDEPWNF